MHGKISCSPSQTHDRVLYGAAALVRPTQSWAGLRRPGCGSDSGLTPGSGSA
jgi:hypothetical protein